MSLTPLRLPRLQQGLAIVDPKTGRPSAAFVRYWNVELLTAIERQINDIAALQAELAAQLVLIQDAQADIVTAQTQLAAQVVQIQALLGIAQGAAQAANNAQASADAAAGGATKSGSGTNPAVNVPSSAWVSGPVVNLTGVVAGNLTISGTGPTQDSDVQVTGLGGAAGEYRVVEVIGGVDTVLFTGEFDAFQGGGDPQATVTNLDATAVTAFSSARASVGAVDYRIDVRCTTGAMTSLKLYIYARRAA